MAFNQKRASTSSSASFTASVNPRRQSSYGHIMAGTGGLPSAHTAAIKSSIAAAASSSSSPNSSNSTSNGSKRLSGLHLLNPLHSQHRNRSLKARIGRACPSLIHGSPRRRRSLWVMLCTGSIVVLIYFLSTWDIKTSVLDRTSFSSSSFSSRALASSSDKQPPLKLGQRNYIHVREPPVVYKNPDGSDMDAKSAFMVRDFGLAQCQHAFAGAEKEMPQEVRLERERMRDQSWKSTSRADAWRHSLDWKRSMKRILPNWKEYNAGWVGQGVVLTSFRGDALEADPSTNTLLVQIKLIRSLSSIPIEVWFTRAADVSEELHETLISWGAIVRSLDDNRSTVQDAVVQSSDADAAAAPIGSLELPIRTAEIQEVQSRIGSSHPAQLHRALTVAALINSGFEDIIYFAPSTLPTMSPRLAFQHPGYLGSGAMFWQHPTSPPAHDSPIWPIIQADCISTAYEQSWSSFALKHKDSWKGLFLAWYWLTGPEAATYEKIFGEQGHDLLRLAWVAVGRPYSTVDRMPQAGLLDLSRAKGEGLGCNLGATLYPAAGSPVLEDPVQYLKDQRQHQRLFQQSYRYGTHEDFFIENTNVMMVDAGSMDRHLYKALDRSLGTRKDPTRLLLTDAYAAGPEGKVCLRVTRTAKGHRHD
ncbi:unnamed protein product [Mortierella alpina]